MDEVTDEVNWPSTRVAKGGIFNLPKVRYSKETHDFLNRKLRIIHSFSMNAYARFYCMISKFIW